ncbi:hypothetical protein CEXT_578991 [Caerostris extrusa]|uniref:Uncharacterized protein n=1 Tax=Caerostris extrusa TaxID=172846 RepID=A0AAV4VDJ1_CAEEX|nr:hypothetical protein CEXT_578991 [Caerostris extrusa]
MIETEGLLKFSRGVILFSRKKSYDHDGEGVEHKNPQGHSPTSLTLRLPVKIARQQWTQPPRWCSQPLDVMESQIRFFFLTNSFR